MTRTVRRTRQPSSDVGANAYWLKKGLFCLYIPGIATEIVHRGIPTKHNSSDTPLPGIAGNCLVSNATTTSYVSFSDAQLPELNSGILTQWSAVALVQPTDATSGAENVIACVNYDGTTVPILFGLMRSAGPGSGSAYYNGSWHGTGMNRNIWGDNYLHTVGAVFQANSRLELWIDGTLDSSGTPSTGTAHVNTNPVDIGTYRGDTKYGGANIFCVALFSQPLVSDDMQLLTRTTSSIWQLLHPIVMPTLYQPEQAAVTGLLGIGASSGGMGGGIKAPAAGAAGD